MPTNFDHQLMERYAARALCETMARFRNEHEGASWEPTLPYSGMGAIHR
jgi:hypothetical protein